MKKIKSIMFDMDGVLIDAKDWHYEALNKALKLFGYEISRYEHLEIYDGLPTRVKLKMLTKEKGLPEGLHEFINSLKQQYTFDTAFNNCRPRFIHEFTLSKLHADGYKIAVCTNSVRKSTLMMLEKAALLKYIDLVVSNEDIKKPKPDPEMYITAAKKFKSLPKECLVIEDNEHGIKAAKAFGGNLIVVHSSSEVTYENIKDRINQIEGK